MSVNTCKDYGSDSAIHEDLLTYFCMQQTSRLPPSFTCYRKEKDRCPSCILYWLNPKQTFRSDGRTWNRMHNLLSHQCDFEQFVSVATKALLLNGYLLAVRSELMGVSLRKTAYFIST